MRPKLVMSSNPSSNKDIDVDFAIKSGFDGVDWSFDSDRMPFNNESRSQFFSQIRRLRGHQIEVRFHTPFRNAEIGHRDHRIARRAMELHLETLGLIAKVKGQFLTLHVGLGNIADEEVCFKRVQENLKALNALAITRGITITLENLRHGPTSIPEQWIELLKEARIPATFDFGHAKACDAVTKGLWNPLAILNLVKERLIHAHIYKEENGKEHLPPKTIGDLGIDLLDALMETSCRWWVIELRERKVALDVKKMLEAYIVLWKKGHCRRLRRAGLG
ncbi:MAG: TIM barrel protein [Pseudomonadota bacterium]